MARRTACLVAAILLVTATASGAKEIRLGVAGPQSGRPRLLRHPVGARRGTGRQGGQRQGRGARPPGRRSSEDDVCKPEIAAKRRRQARLRQGARGARPHLQRRHQGRPRHLPGRRGHRDVPLRHQPRADAERPVPELLPHDRPRRRAGPDRGRLRARHAQGARRSRCSTTSRTTAGGWPSSPRSSSRPPAAGRRSSSSRGSRRARWTTPRSSRRSASPARRR